MVPAWVLQSLVHLEGSNDDGDDILPTVRPLGELEPGWLEAARVLSAAEISTWFVWK